MIGRLHSKSLIKRLEELEARKPSSLIFEIETESRESRYVSFSELMSMREPPHTVDNIHYHGLPEFRIVEGGNLKELDELLSCFPSMGGGLNEH